MFICRNCGKFSKKEAATAKKCKKCGHDMDKPVVGPAPVGTTGVHGQGTVVLFPGFGGVIDLKANKEYGESKAYHGSLYQELVLRYSESVDIPGTSYHHILPTQDKVSKNIVAKKVAWIKELATEGLYPEVIVGKEQKKRGLALSYDGHHTFVAALKIGSPIVLKLGGALMNGAEASWAQCVYVEKFDNEREEGEDEFSVMPSLPKPHHS